LSPISGAIIFTGAVGSFLLNVTTGLSEPVVGSTAEPELDLNSVNVSGTGGTLTIALSDSFTSPPAPYVTGFASSIGGTLPSGGASISYTSWLNGGQSLGGGFSAGPTGSGTTVPFAGQFVSADVSAALSLPYTLTQVVTLTLPGGGVVSFDANLEALPEPFSLLLVGTGLVGLGFLSRRRMQRAGGAEAR
jgi:hypothetical protein